MGFDIYNPRTLFAEDKFKCLVRYPIPMGGLDGDKKKQAAASRCAACGKCLEKCPHQLDIAVLLEEVREEFETWRLKLPLLYGKYFFAGGPAEKTLKPIAKIVFTNPVPVFWSCFKSPVYVRLLAD